MLNYLIWSNFTRVPRHHSDLFEEAVQSSGKDDDDGAFAFWHLRHHHPPDLQTAEPCLLVPHFQVRIWALRGARTLVDRQLVELLKSAAINLSPTPDGTSTYDHPVLEWKLDVVVQGIRLLTLSVGNSLI